ncbi:hypothetical protein EOD41_08540 [Mucilaginibacter limnophilus]|uniref:EcsC family protein n=1 Tax=Mucilaginibacter limnophilus TaxID=1932778 RepID=A0A3S3TIQ9_9SPHI|nr:hypothetical protein [Mucilaginibacter limnophilus]RVU01990.1 hypothetical protein EOD41_08540 [Mucilaginibacter limnophilus]
MKALKKISTNIKQQADRLAHEGFKQIFSRIDQLGVKKGVDKLGLDKFIEQCAYMAAGSGALSGTGGLITMMAGMPVDVANLITQQFRVTMAVMYYTKGNYKINFNEFMSVVAASMKVEAGVAVAKTAMEAVAEKIMLKFGARAAQRLVPVVGAVIGGTANYLFIKRMAASVKELNGYTKEAIVIQPS